MDAHGLRELVPLPTVAPDAPNVVPIRPDEARGAAGRETRELVGAHPIMRRVHQLIDRVSQGASLVLVRGESGTGKELVADAIHARSARAGAPLVKLNCGALTETLLHSELFGHERGAFTGAVERTRGCFEAAHRGTLFLDEVGDVSPRAQVALLRVLEERRLSRVGSTTAVPIDVRVVCATNRDLEAMVARGELRPDLYYRLQAIQIRIPPLRERIEDIPLLARHLLSRIAEERRESPRRLDEEAQLHLLRLPWPGNVRELDNVLRGASLFCEGETVTRRDLEEHGGATGPARTGPAARRGSPRGSASPWRASACASCRRRWSASACSARSRRPPATSPRPPPS